MKFRRADGSFDVADFEHAVDIVFLAQEIVVGPSSYPTEEIGDNARALPPARPRLRQPRRLPDVERPALRLRRGPRGRRRDHRADDRPRLPQVGRGRRRDRPLRRVREEPRAAQRRDADAPRRRLRDRPTSGSRTASCCDAARASWDEAVALGEEHGYRNAQATVLAPTGTISFLMDCDTTGIEPDFSLVKFKELVGGGQMTIVNRSVPLALRDARLHRGADRADRRLHQRERHDRRRPRPRGRAPAGLRRRRRRARDLPHGPHRDDGRDPAVHLRARSRRRSTCRRRRPSTTSPTPTRRAGRAA